MGLMIKEILKKLTREIKHTHTHTYIYIYIYICAGLADGWTGGHLKQHVPLSCSSHLTWKKSRFILSERWYFRMINYLSIPIYVFARRIKDELINDVLLWTPPHWHTSNGWSAVTYINQVCADAVWKTCQEQWTIGVDGEKCVCVCVLVEKLSFSL